MRSSSLGLLGLLALASSTVHAAATPTTANSTAATATTTATKCSSTITTVQGSVRPWQSAGSPAAPHSPAWGWNYLPDGNTQVCFANLLRNVKLFGSSTATIPIYESNDVNRAQVTRIVLGVQALGADSWHYWTNLANTRNKAGGNNAGFDKTKVSIIVPQFIRVADKDAGAATPTDLWFDPETYGYGGSALGPAGSTSISTLDVLDALVRWVEGRYPSVQRIVFAGHSLGAQLIQRYALLRRDGQGTRARLDFAIMNAGSYAYPVATRARPFDQAACPNYDVWPFGLAQPAALPPYASADFARLGKSGLMSRMAGRNVHLLLGDQDYASGTEKCQALAQGSYHLSRGRFYVEGVVNATGTWSTYVAAGGSNRFKSSVGRGQAGLPAPWTYDIVPGCAHVQECMYQSPLGIKRLMLDGYGGSVSSRDSVRGSRRQLLGRLQDEEE